MLTPVFIQELLICFTDMGQSQHLLDFAGFVHFVDYKSLLNT